MVSGHIYVLCTKVTVFFTERKKARSECDAKSENEDKVKRRVIAYRTSARVVPFVYAVDDYG